MAPIRAQAKFAPDGKVMVRVAGPQPVQYGPERRGEAMRKLGEMATRLGAPIQLDTMMPDGSVEQALFRVDGSVSRRPAPTQQVARPARQEPPKQRQAPEPNKQQHPAPEHQPAQRVPRATVPPRRPAQPQAANPAQDEQWSAVATPEASPDKIVTLKESAAWVFPHLSRQMWIGIIVGAAVLIAGITIATVLSLGQTAASPTEGDTAEPTPTQSGQVFHFEDPTVEE